MGIKSKPRILKTAFVIVLVLAAMGTGATRNRDSQLKSFYAVLTFFSDYLPAGFDEIVDVAPLDEGVRVRVIRISLANEFCGGQLVRASEAILKDASVRQVAGRVNICALSPAKVDAKLKTVQASGGDIADSTAITVVAQCGNQEQVFEFPYPAESDFKVVEKRYPQIAALWEMPSEIRDRVFGDSLFIERYSEAQEQEYRDLGTKLLPELVSGKFNAGFPDTCGDKPCSNYLGWLLTDYQQPAIDYDLSSVELVNADALHLAHYEAPRYPRIAKVANMSGEVQLKITVDPATGAVKDVQASSRWPMLSHPAEQAAKNWKFRPGENTAAVEAVVRFTLCRDRPDETPKQN